MKKTIKLLGFIALIAVIELSMTACPTPSDSKDDTGEGGGGSYTLVSGVQVKYMDVYSLNFPDYNDAITGYKDTLDFDHSYWDGIKISDIPGSSVKVINGKLYMTLGTPKANSLQTTPPQPGATISPSNVKYAMISLQLSTSDEKYLLSNLVIFPGGFSLAIFNLVYVDRDATAKGSYTEAGYTYTYNNCTLKKGWNFMYFEDTGINTYTINFSQTLPSGYSWLIEPNA